jgi:hypothetical protein
MTRTTPISFSVVNPQDTLSLAPYTGPFGEPEARTLFERFGFGAPPERIAQAMSDGLETTITKLTTWQSEKTPYDIDAIVFDYGCDTWIKGDPLDGRERADGQPGACNPGDPYDFRFSSYTDARLIYFLHSPNQYFYKLILFLHDERMAGSDSDADKYFYRHVYVDHWNMLVNAAKSGDFIQFMRDWMKDGMGHVFWLSGENNLKALPNENFAREFWELGTLGTTDLNGNPVYTDIDIANAARVHTGYSRAKASDNLGVYHYGVYNQADHATGAYDIFVNTPYYAKVSTQEELLQATFRHPRAAEGLAEDLWKEFINPQKDANAIRQLAQIIRDSNYNLTPVMRVIMRSKALYAPGSKDSLIKQPLELLIGFLRSLPGYNPTNIHSGDDYTALAKYSDGLGQVVLSPNTVFGWDEKVLAGASYVKAWRDVVNQLVTTNIGTTGNFFAKYNLESNILNGLTTTDDVIDRLSHWFNVPLNSGQRNFLNNYLNTQPKLCTSSTTSQPTCSAGDKFYTQPSPFFTSGDRLDRLKGVITILVNQPSYRTK